MKMKFTLLFVLTVLFANPVFAQRKNKKPVATTVSSRDTKLVVGIVVEEMEYDYLSRFWNHFGTGGFKRLVNQGFNCKNHHFNYMSTSDGAGQASIYTGTSPSVHGIIGDHWYDRKTDTILHCAQDVGYKPVGASKEIAGISPHRLLTNTMTDKNRVHTTMQGKTIAISLKAVSAILSGGYLANGAYWFEGGEKGQWISSSYYMDSLPDWVTAYNEADKVEGYKKPWNLLGSSADYTQNNMEDPINKKTIKGDGDTGFPFDIPSLWGTNGQSDVLRDTPFGNAIVTDFALEALKSEMLGADAHADFLAICYSSTASVAHRFGANAAALKDTYLRLDHELTRLLNALDAQVGNDNYTLFLTTNHIGTTIATDSMRHEKPERDFKMDELKERFERFLTYKYGTTDLVKNISKSQVYLDKRVIDNLDMDLVTVQEELAFEFLKYDEIDRVFTGHQMWIHEYTQGLPHLIQNSWHQKRSGDLLLLGRLGQISNSRTEGNDYLSSMYRTHAPLIFYGNGIQKGKTLARTEVTDITPTIAILLGFSLPNGVGGKPIVGVFD